MELYDYIDALTGEKLLQTLADAKPISVEAAIPQFNCAYELELNAMLETLGIRRAFDEMQADFTAMAVSTREICISERRSIKPLSSSIGRVRKPEPPPLWR